MMLKQVVPCTSMALFVPEEETDTLVGRFAAGAHAERLRALSTSPGDGMVGWVAANRRSAVNAEPALDFGYEIARLDPPLTSCLAVPLVHERSLVAVLCLYGSARFTEDHSRLLDLLGPRLAASLAALPQSPAFGTRASDLRLVKRPA
jgi:GAF domain-containing protein